MSALFDSDALLRLLDELYPRMLGQIDRDPDSPTYGSCDRHHWMYRLHDFDSGVVQQASLTLATLVELCEWTRFPGCRYLDVRHREYWRRLAMAVNARNVATLGRRGTFDEYYPGERSFPATVFAGYATLRSACSLGQDEVVRHPGLLATATRFLPRDATPAANQDTAAAAFLALYARTLDWRPREVHETVSRLLARRPDGGEFLEYGGIDLGYLSVSLNYLAYLARDGTHPVEPLVRRNGALLAEFVSPAGRLGGEFASRATTYLLPYGLLAASYLDAELAARLGRIDVEAAYAKLDDRYLMHYCLPSLAAAALELLRRGPPRPAPGTRGAGWRRSRPGAGTLWVCEGPDAMVVVGLDKGGTCQVETPAGVDVDCGWRIERNGETFATCVLDRIERARLVEGDDATEIHVEARFQRYGVLVATPLKTILLRLASVAGALLSGLFKRLLIQDARVLEGVLLERCIRVDLRSGTVTIDDRLSGVRPGDRVTPAPAASLRLVPSAKFHQSGEEQALLRTTVPDADGRVRRVLSLGVGAPASEAASSPQLLPSA